MQERLHRFCISGFIFRKKMKFYYDLEFYEDGLIIDPISIGLVSETGEELYIINKSFSSKRWEPWLADNVQPFLRSIEPENENIHELEFPEIVDTLRPKGSEILASQGFQ